MRFEGADDERLTGTGLVIGTPTYMSPEQVGGGPVDGRSDQYSLACVIYEMLAGEPPFTGKMAFVVLKKTMTETPVPITTIRDAVPPDVDAALNRLLAKAPADRYADAGELVGALSALESSTR